MDNFSPKQIVFKGSRENSSVAAGVSPREIVAVAVAVPAEATLVAHLNINNYKQLPTFGPTDSVR